ncbi:MAG: pyridoxine 5'-phosphate synthase [Myxococcales bacterium]|nr:pyridoxine 5'-phosphate synthase [Myxococcales bacterium]MDD9964627.1 pyridoxine 5'-phosphate synthase [Myxococcales bacterium]
MTRLSVNLNKVATLRNARGGRVPDVLTAAEVCLAAGAKGITVHPRADQRHIRPDDVTGLAERLRQRDATDVEFNIEGDPRPDWLDLVRRVRPQQATLVPVRPGEVTSEAGWAAHDDVRTEVSDLRDRGIRVSLFVEADLDAVRWAERMGAERVELYTEPFAAACQRGEGAQALPAYVEAATLAHSLGLGVNAGHDLDLDNLPLFRSVPYLDEVSIGHALISRALFVGLGRVVKEYLDLLASEAPRGW